MHSLTELIRLLIEHIFSRSIPFDLLENRKGIVESLQFAVGRPTGIPFRQGDRSGQMFRVVERVVEATVDWALPATSTAPAAGHSGAGKSQSAVVG
jgi:hypothetical protein